MHDLNEQLQIIWKVLEKYRDVIPEGVKENDEEWDDITTAMWFIADNLDLE